MDIRESLAQTLWLASTVSGMESRPRYSLSAGKEKTFSRDCPDLLNSRDFCVYSKMGETDGTLYCFTYQDAIHHPVCEDPIPDSTTQSFSTSDDGFVPPFLDP